MNLSTKFGIRPTRKMRQANSPVQRLAKLDIKTLLEMLGEKHREGQRHLREVLRIDEGIREMKRKRALAVEKARECGLKDQVPQDPSTRVRTKHDRPAWFYVGWALELYGGTAEQISVRVRKMGYRHGFTYEFHFVNYIRSIITTQYLFLRHLEKREDARGLAYSLPKGTMMRCGNAVDRQNAVKLGFVIKKKSKVHSRKKQRRTAARRHTPQSTSSVAPASSEPATLRLTGS